MQFNLKVCKSWSFKSFLFRSTLNNPSNCYVSDDEFHLIFSTRQVFDETPHPQIVFIEFAKTCSLKVHGIFVIDLINYQLQNPLTKTLYKIIWGKCAEWYFICKKNVFQIICNFFSFIFWNRPVNHNIKTLLIYVWTILNSSLCIWLLKGLVTIIDFWMVESCANYLIKRTHLGQLLSVQPIFSLIKSYDLNCLTRQKGNLTEPCCHPWSCL